MRKLKELLYALYGPFGLLLLIALVYVAIFEDVEDPKSIITAIAVILSAIYFIQKQKLEEDKLFFEAFSSFNKRFTEQSSLLHKLPKEGEPGNEQNAVIANYFDLCAEEYYFYKHGRIPKDVWACWAKGMLYYIDNYPCVLSYWEDMEKQKANYGLSISLLKSTCR